MSEPKFTEPTNRRERRLLKFKKKELINASKMPKWFEASTKAYFGNESHSASHGTNGGSK